MNNIFTVDVEEYYHADNITSSLPNEKIATLDDRLGIGLRKILSLLEMHNSKATFFILGCVAEKNKGLIREIAGLGHEIASHGYNHIPLFKHTPKTFEDDLSSSVKTLSDICGQKIIGYRAMNFSFSSDVPWFFDLLKKYGLIYDSSIACSLFRNCQGINSRDVALSKMPEDILEFPVSSLRIGKLKIPLGGGYFRIYPYWLTKLGLIRVAMQKNAPPLFYIHPWELDKDQPRFKLPLIKRFRHYVNLASVENKLQRLLSEIKFISIADYLKVKE